MSGSRRAKTDLAAAGTPEAVAAAIRNGQLVVVVGSGVSLSMTEQSLAQLSWLGLVRNGLHFAAETGCCTAEQRDERLRRIDGNDVDDLIDVAEYVQRKLGGPAGDMYGRWLRRALEHARPSSKPLVAALRRLAAAKTPICTLNYDLLLEAATGLPSITLDDAMALPAWLDGRKPAILHLHGLWTKPETCVLGLRDYAATVTDERRAMLQRALGSLKQLLFIGCGDTFADPNFSSLVRWLRQHMGAAAPQHHALVPERDVARRAQDPAWQGFVDPLPFGADFDALPGFLSDLVPRGAGRRPPARVGAAREPRLEHRQALQAYRDFLVKDCGQMSIEGVRADLDTAQRKFDLERLFVPLKVRLLPSGSREGDDDGEQSRERTDWARDRDAKPFGEVFAHEQRLALLALPGGGKTMLLKRLTVAYLQPELRRGQVDDALPDLPLVPVLIRCREWRDHIRKPLLTLLTEIGRVTGQLGLERLRDALIPHFKDGTALLLIDGLDEIHDAADRTVFVENVESFALQFPKTRLVLTSREAGFDLVAPNLRRLCSSWRIEPLGSNAIRLLCEQWQRLMVGDSPESLADGRALAADLSGEASRLARLAENPLLLTMLLVVKHGAGRLPPDRVSLYERAVDVLLDTWNIKGHDKLGSRESVPQLACVAFERLQAGRQTATAAELVDLLEQARQQLPAIARYAHDAPSRFLERVELRSSLLIQAGRQREGARDVPFYQFRHLTFQEYLAAVAVCDGHYLAYRAGDDVLTPLASHLLANEWKEVVPMAAVMAGKRAEPLLQELVRQAAALRPDMEAGRPFAGHTQWLNDAQPPAAVDRLLTCFVEEVEADPATASAALELIVLFARGDIAQGRIAALARGPYGADAWRHVFRLLDGNLAPVASWIELTAAMLGAGRVFGPQGVSEADTAAIRQALGGSQRESVCLALFMVAGLIRQAQNGTEEALALGLVDTARLHALMKSKDALLRCAALWTWATFRQRLRVAAAPARAVLDLLLDRWLNGVHAREQDLAAHALFSCTGMKRSAWSPRLGAAQRRRLRRLIDDDGVQWETWVAVCVVAFHDRNVWTDAELLQRLHALRTRIPNPTSEEIVKGLLADRPDLAEPPSR